MRSPLVPENITNVILKCFDPFHWSHMTTKWHSRLWAFGLASVPRFVLFAVFFVNIYVCVRPCKTVFSSFFFFCGNFDRICGINCHDVLVNLFSPISLAYWTNINPNNSSI